MIWPNEMSGPNPLGSWLNKLLRAAKASQIVPGVGYSVRKTPDGTAIDLGIQSTRPRPFSIVPSSDWLTYQVTGGYIITNGDLIVPTGTDTNIALTGGVEKYWLYLDITTTTASVEKSATAPDWDVNKVPIGWVDTDTNSGTTQSTAYQFLWDNVYIPCA
jgi:hypothetical protein